MKLSAKTKRKAAQIAAASIRATIGGMIGGSAPEILQALILEAEILERKAGATSGKQDAELHDDMLPLFMKINPAEQGEVPE